MFSKSVLPKAFFIGALLLLGASSLALASNYYYFPMVADGIIGSNGYCTRYTLKGDENTTGYLRFFNSDGTDLSLRIHCPEIPSLNGVKSEIDFAFNDSANQTVTIITWGVYNLRTGWAWVYSDSPLMVVDSAYCFYPNVTNGPITWEAAVPPAESCTGFNIEANISQNEPWNGLSVDTGLALANPHGKAIDIKVRLGSTVKTVTLSPWGQYAIYLSSLFSGFSFGDRYVDRVLLTCPDNFFAMGMRSVNGASGEICSTLPAISYRQRMSQQSPQWKPNATWNAANRITFNGTQTATVYGSFNGESGVAEKGSYKVHLPAGVTLYAYLACASLGSLGHCQHFELWDSTHVIYTGQNFGETPANQTGPDDAYMEYAVTTEGDYWISVTGYGTASTGNNTFYELYIRYQ